MITLGVLAPKNAANDPFFNNVSLLLHGNGTNNSTTFTDSSSHNRTITVGGGAKISTTQSKFGGSSMFFDGTGDYAFNDGNTTNAAWTAECWYYCQDNTIDGLFCIGGTIYQLSMNHTGTLLFTYGGGLNQNTGISVPLNTWTHLALSMVGGGNGPLRIFQNGTLGFSYSNTMITPDSKVTLAAYNSTDRQPGQGKYNGYIDDFRYTVGTCRYTSNFTAPSAQFPDS